MGLSFRNPGCGNTEARNRLARRRCGKLFHMGLSNVAVAAYPHAAYNSRYKDGSMSSIVAALLAVFCLTHTSQPMKKPAAKPTLYYIPHTHWEGAVFKTR